jgi:N,N'-diacetyllegionaminate synthase
MMPFYTIAEIGQAHEGSLGLAHSYIDALVLTGVDAIKFQVHIAEAESSEFESFRVKFSYEDATRFDYWKRMEFSIEQWQELKNHCEDKGVDFLASPFSVAAVNLLNRLGVNAFKIGSGEVTNWLMLEHIARTGKQIYLSSGMSSWQELDETVKFLAQYESPLTILQCTTAYPTLPHQWGLQIIPELKRRYNCPVGYSDHSGDIFACLGATALGADVLEFHAVFDKRMFGPDAPASITINDIEKLITGVRAIRTALQAEVNKENVREFDSLKKLFGKSLAINKDLKKGQVLTFDDLESKKPAGLGISAREYQRVLGKHLSVDMKKWEFLREEHIND